MKRLLLLALPLFGNELQSGPLLSLGGSYNCLTLDQHFTGTEFSSLFSGVSLVALGQAGGATPPSHTTQSTLAPQGSLGYLHRFANTSWLLGGKTTYQYLGLTFTEELLDSFPTALYAAVGGGGPFTGRLSIDSIQTEVTHELFLLPLFGYSFPQSSVYLGAGPIAFFTQKTLYGVTGSTHLSGAPSDLVGGSPSTSSSHWLFGGVAELGWLYPLSESFFLQCTYSYALTEKVSSRETLLFSHTLITTSTYTEEGVASLQSDLRLTAQSFAISLNKVF